MTQSPDPAHWGLIWSRPFSAAMVFDSALNLEARFVQPPEGIQYSALGGNRSSFHHS